MTKLTWGDVGQKVFEAGVDRGVLYVDGKGVSWNGLVSVSEAPAGADITENYVDGIKYLVELSDEEFAGTVQAFTYPDEFAQCDGTASVGNGLFVRHQKRKSFDLSYRTKVGNDVNGVDLGYKIHIIYNALASPSQQDNNTLTDNVSPQNFSWQITTKPPSFKGYKPTAHLVIDSRTTPKNLLDSIEAIMYGNEIAAPRLPSVDEFIFLFTAFDDDEFDAGPLTEEYYADLDAGQTPTETVTDFISGGTP